MGFTLGGSPKQPQASGQAGQTPSSFKLGGGPGVKGAKPAPPKHSGGFLHTLGHVASQTPKDFANAALGLGPGVVKIGKLETQALKHDVGQAIHHPTETQSLHDFLHGNSKASRELGQIEAGTVQATGQDLAHPLRHPGYTALDLLTLGTAGVGAGARVAAAGRAAKAGEALEAARALVTKPAGRSVLRTRSPRLAQTGKGPAVEKLSETQPLVRGRQVLTNKALAKIRYTRPVLGEGARYGREIRRSAVREGLKEMPAYRAYVAATKRLSDEEWAALNLIPRDVHPADLAEYWKGTQNAKVAADPKVAALVTIPSPRLQVAVEAARALSAQGEQIYKGLGLPADKSPALFRERVAHALGKEGPAESVYPEGSLFHGSPEGELKNIDALYHTKPWREGPGFYLTTSAEKAAKYAAGKTASATRKVDQGALTIAKLKPGTKILDMDTAPESFWRDMAAKIVEEPVDESTYAQWAKDIRPEDAKNASPGVLNRVRLLHFLTGWAELPKSDAYYAIEEALHQQGYQATKHVENGVPVYIVKDANAIERVPKEAIGTKPGERIPADLKPVHGHPFYLPDVVRPTRASDPFAAFGGGKGIPRTPGSAKANRGILQALGKLNLEQDVLGPNFLNRIKLKTHTAVNDALLEGAVKLTPDELKQVTAEHGGIPKDFEFLTGPIATKTGGVRPQRISPLTRLEGAAGATPQSLDELLGSSSLDEHLAEPLGSSSVEKAFFDGQHYYLAPKTTIRNAAGEFHRANVVSRWLIQKPLTVWRTLILGLRVGFLTNNVVGNNVLYAVRTAGIGGLKSYLHAVEEAHGSQTVLKLIRDPATSKRLGNRVTHELMDEFFPEQVQGTFGRTQSPVLESPVPSGARKVAQKARLGIVPATQAAAETLPRRALAETFLRNSPEYRRVYRALPKDTRTFEQAARKTLAEEGPAYQRLISDQINKAMGDYLNLGSFERETVRSLLPFYSWYKAIATITAHLALDTPGRALALQQIGRIGKEGNDQTLGALPSYLQGAIPLGQPGPSTATVLSTQGFNPYATIAQLYRGSTADLSQAGLSPLIQYPLDAYANLKGAQGHPGVSPLAALAEAGKQFVKSLPETRLASPPPPSALYPQQDGWTQLLAYLGVPIKKPDLNEAHYRASQGR